MKNNTRVVYSGPFHINSTQALCGSKSQIVSHSIRVDNNDIIMMGSTHIIKNDTIAKGADKQTALSTN